MAEIYLDLAGVTGESTDTNNTGKIEIDQLSFSVSNATTVGSAKGGSGAQGKAEFANLSIQKYLDSSSTSLEEFCITGKHFATAKFTVRRPGGSQEVFYEVDLTEAYITSYSIGASSGTPVESITMSYATIKMTYTPQAATGGSGTAVSYGYDLTKNTQLA